VKILLYFLAFSHATKQLFGFVVYLAACSY
jgi:hypothetical protein